MEANSRWFREAEQVFAALDGLDMGGDVLELAPGTGIWTERLCRTASRITAVDASEEMIALNRVRLGEEARRVSFVKADLFAWQPDRTFDGVAFGFWISHVPREQLDGFLRVVASALRQGGKLFFVDGRREPTSTASDHVLPEEDSELMTRKLNDGRAFQIVKNFYEPFYLNERFAAAGLSVDVRETDTFFIYGTGHRDGVG